MYACIQQVQGRLKLSQEYTFTHIHRYQQKNTYNADEYM